MFLAAGIVGAFAGGSAAYNSWFDPKHGNASTQVTNATIAQTNTQETYAKSVVNQIQTCATPQTAANILDVVGNFNNLSNITQNLTDNQTMQCVFAATNQQSIQNSLTADLVAQAQTDAAAPINVDATALGGLAAAFKLHSGPMLNSVDIDVNSIQKGVAYTVANQIQNCAATKGSGVNPATGDACFGASGNALCVTGNFNSVTNVNQSADISLVQECFYNATNSQNIVSNLQATMQSAAAASTTSSFTALGWVVWIALFFVVVGLVILVGRWLWRKASAAYASSSYAGPADAQFELASGALAPAE